MKKNSLLLFLFITITSLSQTLDNRLIYGKTDSLYSKILNEPRKIIVYNPSAGISDLFDGKKMYPVVYVFDGEVYFESVVAMTRELSRVGLMPEVVVVGICNTDRISDLTPSHLDTPADLQKAFFTYNKRKRATDGSEKFILFMENELIPHIDSICSTAPYRILIGHSMGGLAAVNILLNHPNLFHSYISIDPVIYWNGINFLTQSSEDFSKKKFENKNLFIAFSNSRNPRTENKLSEKDTSLLEKTMNYCFQWKDALAKNKQTALHWDWKFYKNDSHGTIPFIAEYDGLRSIFDFYWLYIPDRHLPNEKELLIFKADSVYNAYSKEVSRKMGYHVVPPLYDVNDLAYDFLSKKAFDMSYKLFQMNIENYPDNWFVYDGMGDFYKEKGDTKKALEFYKKALTFSDQQETKAKIEKINNAK